VLLIVVGLVALVYQGITYTSRETVIDIGRSALQLEREAAGAHAVAAGAVREAGQAGPGGTGLKVNHSLLTVIVHD
jgi:hypothetical protein